MSKKHKKIEDIADLASLTKEELTELLKDFDIDDFLVYVQDFEDEKTQVTFIALIKIIQQLANGHKELYIKNYRESYDNEPDLKKRLNIIYEMIERHYLLLTDELDKKKKRIGASLRRMDTSDREKVIDRIKNELMIKAQAKQQRNGNGDTSKEKDPSRDTILITMSDIENTQIYKLFNVDYKRNEEALGEFFDEICTLYTNINTQRYDEGRSLDSYLQLFEKILETRDEAETTSFVSNAMEEAMLTYAKDSKLISPELVENLKSRLTRERKAQEFYEKQAQLREQEIQNAIDKDKKKSQKPKKKVKKHKN